MVEGKEEDVGEGVGEEDGAVVRVRVGIWQGWREERVRGGCGCFEVVVWFEEDMAAAGFWWVRLRRVMVVLVGRAEVDIVSELVCTPTHARNAALCSFPSLFLSSVSSGGERLSPFF